MIIRLKLSRVLNLLCQRFDLPWSNAFWPAAVVGEADRVISVSASACHIGGAKGVSPGQKELLHGIGRLKTPSK